MKGVIKFYEARYSETVVQKWNPNRSYVKKIEEKLMENWGGSSSEEQTAASSSDDSFTSLSGAQALPDYYIFSLIKN